RLLYWLLKSVGSFLVRPSLCAMHLFDGGPLFNGFGEMAATDLKQCQPMPKHPFISPESFCMVSNATVYDRPLDPSHRIDPLWCAELAEAAGACGKTLLCRRDRLIGVLYVLIDGGKHQRSSQPVRSGVHSFFEDRDSLRHLLSPNRLQHDCGRLIDDFGLWIWNDTVKYSVYRPQSSSQL